MRQGAEVNAATFSRAFGGQRAIYNLTRIPRSMVMPPSVRSGHLATTSLQNLAGSLAVRAVPDFVLAQRHKSRNFNF